MTTKKTILTKKYLEFKQQTIDLIPDCSLFPSLDDIDIVDIVAMFDTFFYNCKTDEEIIETLNILINSNLKTIKEENKEKLINICLRFIKWFNDFNKK